MFNTILTIYVFGLIATTIGHLVYARLTGTSYGEVDDVISHTGMCFLYGAFWPLLLVYWLFTLFLRLFYNSVIYVTDKFIRPIVEKYT